MSSNEMVEKLKAKIQEIDSKRNKTENEQKLLIETSSKFNEKISNYLELGKIEKNAYNEGLVKLQNINTRIHDCNANINKIREKIKFINTKLDNKINLYKI